MFEAVLLACLSVAPETCRETLVPGFEAPDRAGCEAALGAAAPVVPPVAGLVYRDAPVCQPVGPVLPVEEVAPGLFVHVGAIALPDRDNRGDVANLGFVIGDRAVAVIDAGSARWIGEALWRAVRHETDLPVAHLVLTHLHPDHVLGASVFAEAGAEVIGHARLDRALAERWDTYTASFADLVGAKTLIGSRRVALDIAVAAEMTLDLGGRALRLEAWPMAHSGTDLTALDTATATLFAGDLVFDAHAPALDGSVRGWQEVLDRLAQRTVERVVPGHGAAVLGWPEGAAPLRRYLATLEADTRAAIDAGQRLGEAVETVADSERTHWALFDAYNARNATVAFTELEWE